MRASTIRKIPAGGELRVPGVRGLSIWHRGNVYAWSMQYSFEGARHRLKLGEWPHVDLEEAQRRAQAARDKMVQGIDPRDPGETVAALVEAYIAHVERLKKRTAYEIARTLRTRLVPLYGSRPIRRLRRKDILDMHAGIEAPVAANAAVAITRAFLNWCLDREHVEQNVASRIRRSTLHKAEPRERILSDDELKAIWRASFTAAGFPTYYGAVVRLLILTACRRAEVAQIQPGQIEGRVWTVPGAVTKNATAHRVYLPDLALDQLPEGPDGGRFFPRGISWSRCKFALDRAAGVRDWTLHDLRRTAAARIAEMGTPPHIVEALLNHRPPVLVRTYQVADRDEEKRTAWDRWSGHVKTIVG
jgi:integrase